MTKREWTVDYYALVPSPAGGDAERTIEKFATEAEAKARVKELRKAGAENILLLSPDDLKP